jgi:hypothetical protein
MTEEEFNRITRLSAEIGDIDYSNPIKPPAIERLKVAGLTLSRDGNKAMLLDIMSAILSGMSRELVMHYHSRKYNWALAKHINELLGFQAIRVDDKSRVRLTVGLLEKLR